MPDEDSRLPHASDYEPQTLKVAVHRLYTLFLEEYKILVETNFPTLKNHFKLYSQMPLHYFINVRPDEHCPTLNMLKCKNKYSEINEVTVCDLTDLVHDGSMTFIHGGQEYEIINEQWSAAWDLGANRSHFSALRNLVYNHIQRELSEALDYLFEISN